MITFININSKDKFFGVVQMHLRVDNKYYDGYELIEWSNRKLRVPKHYREYLTEKYGDWSVPQKVWSAKSEGTVFGG